MEIVHWRRRAMTGLEIAECSPRGNSAVFRRISLMTQAGLLISEPDPDQWLPSPGRRVYRCTC